MLHYFRIKSIIHKLEWVERYFFFIQYAETKFSSNNDSQFDEADESKPSEEHHYQ